MLATGMPSRVIWYSWSRMLPCACIEPPEHLGVDPEDPLPPIVLDPEVVPDRQQLLAQQVAGALVPRFATFLVLPPPSPEHRALPCHADPSIWPCHRPWPTGPPAHHLDA